MIEDSLIQAEQVIECESVEIVGLASLDHMSFGEFAYDNESGKG